MNVLETQATSSPENALTTVSDEASRMIELVGFLVQNTVAYPGEVEVEEFVDSAGVLYGVRVHPDDIGRVIGREGRVINALRNLTKASATKVGTHVSIEILSED